MYLGLVIFLVVNCIRRHKVSISQVLILIIFTALCSYIGGSFRTLPFILVLSWVCIIFKDDIVRIQYYLPTILKVNIILFFVMYVAAIFGLYIEIWGAMGLEPQRTTYAHNYRPSGIFLEPNSYCVHTFLMYLSFCFDKKLVTKYWSSSWSNLFLLTLILSRSLWALLPLVILLPLILTRMKSWEKILAVAVATVASVFIAVEMINRISLGILGDELSFIIRIGTLTDWIQRVALLGEGVDFNDWVSPSIFGAWLLIKLGAIPSIVFCIMLFWRTKLSKVYRLVFFLPFLLTQPPVTNLLFWASILCVFRDDKRQ